MFWIVFIIVLLSLLTAYFYSVKVVFAVAWRNEFSDLSPKREAAVKKCIALHDHPDDIDFTVETGKAFSASLLLLASLFLLSVFNFFAPRPTLEAVIKVITVLSLMGLALKVVPKTLSRVFAANLIAVYVPLYNFFETLFWPLTALQKAIKKGLFSLLGFEERLSFLTQAQREQIREGEDKEGTLVTDEKDMINSILEFKETEVGEIMVPRTEVVAVEEGATTKEVISIINEKGHSRLPVYRKSIDEVIGVLNVKDLYKTIQPECTSFGNMFNLKTFIRPAYFVPENKKINELFRELNTEKVHLAVVVDEYGGVCGIVTMEDILEEIVGEINDEYDREEERFRRIDKQTVELDPKIPIEEINEILGTTLDTDNNDYKTLSGLIMTHSGSIPEEGQSFSIEGLRVGIQKMDGHRIMKVRIKREMEIPQ